MEICVDRHTKLNYAEVLDGIAAVVCNGQSGRRRVYDLRDRESLDGNGYPWFEGCFGNSLIYLNAGSTDKLYLMDGKSFKEYCMAVTKENKPNMEKYAKHIIRRV